MIFAPAQTNENNLFLCEIILAPTQTNENNLFLCIIIFYLNAKYHANCS